MNYIMTFISISNSTVIAIIGIDIVIIIISVRVTSITIIINFFIMNYTIIVINNMIIFIIVNTIYQSLISLVLLPFHQSSRNSFSSVKPRHLICQVIRQNWQVLPLIIHFDRHINHQHLLTHNWIKRFTNHSNNYST